MTPKQTELIAPVRAYLAAREGLGLTLAAITNGVTHEGHECHADDAQACLDYLVARKHVSTMGTSTGVLRFAITNDGVFAHQTNS